MESVAERRVRSMSEMQAEANANGIACPRCGCKHIDWDVPESRWFEGGKKRWRVCRNCKHRIDTVEVHVPNGHKVAIVPVKDDE